MNSGRSTRERGIEETALRTNLEAADEAARQLRLRDLAGLIVIDFIDMESKKHISMVERRMAEALKTDRARIQIGHISHFGLLELSRQRLRPSLAETSLNVCTVCGGSGHVRSTESAALHVLREIEEEGGRRRAAEIMVHVAADTALYILNNKRQRLTEIELRYGMKVCFAADNTLLAAQTRIEKLRAAVPQDLPALPAPRARAMPEDDAAEADIAEDEDDVVMPQARTEPASAVAPAGDYTTDADHVPGETAAEGEQRRRRRRRRRRGGRREDGTSQDGASQNTMPDEGASEGGASQVAAPQSPYDGEQPDIPDLQAAGFASGHSDQPAPEPENAAMQGGDIPQAGPDGTEAGAEPALPEDGRPKRGRRGGRRRRKPGEEAEVSAAAAEQPSFPSYVGPTPADPFALSGLDIFDALEQAEMRPESLVVAEAPQPPSEMDPPTPQVPEPEAQETVPAELLVIAEAPQPPPERQAEPSPADHSPSAAEPKVGPPIQPVLVGEAAVAAPKKGWWRR